MKNKTVISDFGDLKGKISFSEGTDAGAKEDKPKGAAQKTSKTSDQSAPQPPRELHVGQSVVLMDSDLRGKIIKLGKTVTIELEDGLMIEAAYGEFAVTCHKEIHALKKAKASKKPEGKASGRTKTPARADISVDLHIEAIPGGRSVPKGQQLQFQLDTFRMVIRENLHHKGIKITFIHGIGDGTLKSAIRKELDEIFVLKCSYSVGDPAVTIVTII